MTYDVEQLNTEIAIGIYTEKLQWHEWNGRTERVTENYIQWCRDVSKKYYLDLYDDDGSLKPFDFDLD